ncbi:MAG: DNA topoisomerase IV subunit B, partial [Desulfobacteraceae bacterium]|nr:DNA topoisomerase IV subunit B [Desulfobacteraceae bacterium]
LGEMNPIQLRETTMAKDTRRLVQLSVNRSDSEELKEGAYEVMDMLLAKKRAGDRKVWLEKKGDLKENHE